MVFWFRRIELPDLYFGQNLKNQNYGKNSERFEKTNNATAEALTSEAYGEKTSSKFLHNSDQWPFL